MSWLGGILIDEQQQGRGYGKQAVQEAIRSLSLEAGASSFALSYQATNQPARELYLSLGFQETGEFEDDEVVARLRLEASPSSTL
jgi:diamine N-acetyltransferase